MSTIDAARSGVAEMVVLTPEQREELTLVETQIKQKLAIGATASKRHLVEDLSRLGVNEWAVGGLENGGFTKDAYYCARGCPLDAFPLFRGV